MRPALGEAGARGRVDLNRGATTTKLRGARTRHVTLRVVQLLGLRRVQLVITEALPTVLDPRNLIACRRAGDGTGSGILTRVYRAGDAERADRAVGSQIAVAALVRPLGVFDCDGRWDSVSAGTGRRRGTGLLGGAGS